MGTVVEFDHAPHLERPRVARNEVRVLGAEIRPNAANRRLPVTPRSTSRMSPRRTLAKEVIIVANRLSQTPTKKHAFGRVSAANARRRRAGPAASTAPPARPATRRPPAASTVSAAGDPVQRVDAAANPARAAGARVRVDSAIGQAAAARQKSRVRVGDRAGRGVAQQRRAPARKARARAFPGRACVRQSRIRVIRRRLWSPARNQPPRFGSPGRNHCVGRTSQSAAISMTGRPFSSR